jgi:hypothetical protein
MTSTGQFAVFIFNSHCCDSGLANARSFIPPVRLLLRYGIVPQTYRTHPNDPAFQRLGGRRAFGIGLALSLCGLDPASEKQVGWCAMEDFQQTDTVAVKACSACEAGLLERDKYCRWCGARQADRESGGFDETISIDHAAAIPPTSMLAPAGRAEVYRRVSGPLVNAVVTGALSGAPTEQQSRFVKRVSLALISIPIWLIIVLLSPFDAYAAVRSLARQ